MNSVSTIRRGRRSSFRVSAVALVAVLALLALAACSSNSSSVSSKATGTASAGTAATGSTPSGAAATGAAITVGTICSCSGLSASDLGPLTGMYQAWVKWVNAHGGLNGSPVNLIVKDDAGSAETALSDAKELVQQDHVMAIIGPISQDDSAWASYVSGQGVPVIGNYDTPFYTNADFFPTDGSVLAGFPARLTLMSQLGDKKLGVLYCAEEPICAESPQLFGLLAKESGSGITVAYSAGVSSTAPSYQAPCLAAKQAGVDFLDIASFASTTTQIIDACAQQGYTPTIMGTPSNLTAADSHANGLWLISPSLSNEDTTTAAGQLYQQIMKAYDPSILSIGPNLEITDAWSGLVVFQAVAEQAKLKPASTSADVKNGLYGLPKGDTFGGETPPLTYVRGQATHVNCWFVVQQKDGKLVMPHGSAAECATPAQVKELVPLYAEASSVAAS